MRKKQALKVNKLGVIQISADARGGGVWPKCQPSVRGGGLAKVSADTLIINSFKKMWKKQLIRGKIEEKMRFQVKLKAK